MTRATTAKGLWGNLRFLVIWKTWATLIVFGVGFAIGLIYYEGASAATFTATLALCLVP